MENKTKPPGKLRLHLKKKPPEFVCRVRLTRLSSVIKQKANMRKKKQQQQANNTVCWKQQTRQIHLKSSAPPLQLQAAGIHSWISMWE